MSIFGVSEEQVRLIIRDELLRQSTNQQAPQQGSVESACKLGANLGNRSRVGECERFIREQSNNCRHFVRDSGRSIRIACDGSCKSKQERYQEKLNQVRELSRDLAIGERQLASMEFELKHYSRDGYAISAMHYACVSQNITMQSIRNDKLHARLKRVLDDLSNLNVI